MTTVQEALAKYKTLGRVVKARDVPLAVRLSAVVYSDFNVDPEGYESIGAMAEALYGLAVSVYEDREKAMRGVVASVNYAALKHRELNG